MWRGIGQRIGASGSQCGVTTTVGLTAADEKIDGIELP